MEFYQVKWTSYDTDLEQDIEYLSNSHEPLSSCHKFDLEEETRLFNNGHTVQYYYSTAAYN